MVKPVNFTGYYRKFGEKAEGSIHLGVDFKAMLKTDVLAIADGVVLDSREISGFGGLNPAVLGGVVFILHNNIVALYGHINREVNIGDKIKEGQVIGSIRDFTNKDLKNGFYHAPHLHFGIWNGEKMPIKPYGYSDNICLWIDPVGYLKSNGVIL
jgi:murein DD-endopeptidase MepM/ murein hydrolase activator NlpD